MRQMVRDRRRIGARLAACVIVAASSGAVRAGGADDAPVFAPAARAVSGWRREAAANLALDPDLAARLEGPGPAPAVARCVKLNNYWCIKRAGWNGEIAADAEGHVAFAHAEDGAAVAALLLKRYYVDFGRHTALSIISHWAPARCGLVARSTARPNPGPRVAGTLRARWLASHPRGFVTALPGHRNVVRRSVVADRIQRIPPMPVIAAGLAGLSRDARPITLDALMLTSANAPMSRTMLGLPGRRGAKRQAAALFEGVSGCPGDSARVTAYAGKAAAGLALGPDGDLALFTAAGAPTQNLSLMMANMARVEIGPLGADPGLIARGIAAAFRPGRNPGQ